MEIVKFIFFDIGYTLVNEDNVWLKRCIEQSSTQEAQLLGITADTLWHDIQTATAQLRPQWQSIIEKYDFTYLAKYDSDLEFLYDDSHIVLDTLSKRFNLGIIANQKSGLFQRLHNWHIDKFFKTVISSEDLGFYKPDKRLFLAALEKSGCAACNAVMVGDRLDNDILPANELGFQTVWIKQGFAKEQIPPSISYVPTYEINNLTELLELPFVLH